MKNAKLVWNDQNLDKFLQNPAALVHGTKMFVGVPDAAARQHIVAYLQGLKPQATAGK
jgi:cytochrome c